MLIFIHSYRMYRKFGAGRWLAICRALESVRIYRRHGIGR